MDRLDRLDDKLDRITESTIRLEEQLSVVQQLLKEHDARTVRAVQSAQAAHARVDALENLFTVPMKWVKILAAVAGAVTAVVGAWKLLGE